VHAVNILLLTPQPPFPPRQGTAIRNWGILRHLATHNTLTLLSFAPSDIAEPAPELAASCRSIELVAAPTRNVTARISSVVGGQADLEDRLWSSQFDHALRRTLASTHFDLVQIEGLELGRYLSTIRDCVPQTPIVYDAHNAEVTIQQRAWRSDRLVPSRWPAAAYSLFQVPRLARFEAAVCRQASVVTCVSQVDASTLGRLVPGLQPVVIPNGIDLEDYALPPSAVDRKPILTFTGKMDYRPNVDAALWFAREILPRIRAQQPKARFEVVGQNPAPRLARLDGKGGVAVLGAVSDTRPYIARCAVFVAPLRMGGGTRFKLLEAMALGRPVVATTIGAQGFSVETGRELLIADTAADFARTVLRVLGDARLARQLPQAGRAFVEAGYDWAAIIPRLEALHQQLVSKAQFQSL
jgi:sugar transferase (PEP-CTERM/EpsH1 system associated)